LEETLNLIKNRRSVRRYVQGKVPPEEYILKILEAGIWAPSGLNNQPWKFVIVKDPEVKKRLAELTRYYKVVESAPVLIAVLLDKEKMYHQIKDHQSAGACLQNMMLMATALGLGTCWLGEILNREKEVKEVLGLNPEAYELCAVLAVGYPDDSTPRKGRNPLESFILKTI
jgi:nitroreductase